MTRMDERAAGVLLHPTSLPGRYGIGDMGDELIAFLDAVRSGGLPAVTGDEGVASLEIATRCLQTPARPASSARKGPRRVVG